VSVGDSLVVAVRLTGASGVTSLPFHVEFDPAVLEFLAVEEGPAVGGAMQPILLASVSPARPGDLAVGLSLVETGGLLRGAGTVMRLKFRAIGPGASPLDFSRATIRGRMSEPMDARFQNAAVEVR
jgi:Cohesin domain